jgi:hypothetical protein
LWPFSTKGEDGYGTVSYLGKISGAHRVMCTLAHGKPPTRKHIPAHSCAGRLSSWKRCVNPNHLSWKTLRATLRESAKRHPENYQRGQQRHKLTAEKVAQIRALEGDHTQRELAGMFGTLERNIGKILQRKTWVTGERRIFGGDTSKGRRLIVQRPRFEAARFYVPRAVGVEFSDGTPRPVLIVGPEQHETQFALLAALEKLHPSVKMLVLAVLEGADLEQAAIEAHIGPGMLASLLPRLRTFLTPYVRVTA